MKKGKTNTFFQPTKFKVITALIIASLYPLALGAGLYCLASHSKTSYAVCGETVDWIYNVLIIHLFGLPSLILSAHSLFGASLDIIFTLIMSYVVGCSLAAILKTPS